MEWKGFIGKTEAVKREISITTRCTKLTCKDSPVPAESSGAKSEPSNTALKCPSSSSITTGTKGGEGFINKHYKVQKVTQTESKTKVNSVEAFQVCGIHAVSCPKLCSRVQQSQQMTPFMTNSELPQNRTSNYLIFKRNCRTTTSQICSLQMPVIWIFWEVKACMLFHTSTLCDAFMELRRTQLSMSEGSWWGCRARWVRRHKRGLMQLHTRETSERHILLCHSPTRSDPPSIFHPPDPPPPVPHRTPKPSLCVFSFLYFVFPGSHAHTPVPPGLSTPSP